MQERRGRAARRPPSGGGGTACCGGAEGAVRAHRRSPPVRPAPQSAVTIPAGEPLSRGPGR